MQRHQQRLPHQIYQPIPQQTNTPGQSYGLSHSDKNNKSRQVQGRPPMALPPAAMRHQSGRYVAR